MTYEEGDLLERGIAAGGRTREAVLLVPVLLVDVPVHLHPATPSQTTVTFCSPKNKYA